MCPEKAYAVSITEPAIPSLLVVKWTITDTLGATIAHGVGGVVLCSVYGMAGSNAYCQSSPTLHPTPNPTVVVDTTYTNDALLEFDSGIWEKQCDACSYQSGLLVAGIDFQRTQSSAFVRKLEVTVKF